MSRDLTKPFMEALNHAEETGDVEALVALYADNSTSRNLTDETWSGPDGAREFWRTYLNNFQQIHSEFHAVSGDDRTGNMEWISRGQLKGGRDIEYRGISVIESEGGKVQAFRTYYDSAAFVAPAS
ncbi:nuclear transport factor 2 family protein [Deinococcus sonorensis]|uniref:Nuclear transport factor 2 family protein n=2 Tax=Deinococcus sonorensis TaxID=309891 RepID=A0AAU7UB45_9DEIO